MKILTFLLIFYTGVSQSQDLVLPALNVYDADTIYTQISLPEPLNDIGVRLKGIDSPEVPAKSYKITGKLGRSSCYLEAELALQARDFVKEQIKNSNNVLYLRNYEYGTYARRIVADVYIKPANSTELVKLSDLLLQAGYAVPYDGKSKRSHDWCK